MDIQALDKKDNKISFLIKGTDASYVNALRRTMLSQVPSLAIRKVTFIKNNSALFDEMIAHRLGLIPLVTDLDSFDVYEDLPEDKRSSPRAQVSVHVYIQGPTTLYSSDLKFQDSNVKAVEGKIPIVKLLKGQELEFEAIATLGRGKEHTKFSPCTAYYKSLPKISLGKIKNPEEVVKSCPVDVYELQGNEVKIKRLHNCHLCMACVDVAEPEGAVAVHGSEKDFIFTIEAWGQLAIPKIMERALDELDQECEHIKEGFGK